MKRFTLIALVLILTLLSASIAAAQEPGNGQQPPAGEEGQRPEGRGGEHGDRGGRPGGRGGRLFGAVAEQLGVEREEIHEFIQANEGVTFAQVIEHFGGDVPAFIDQRVAEIVERTGRDEAEVRAEVEERLNRALEPRGEHPPQNEDELEAGESNS